MKFFDFLDVRFRTITAEMAMKAPAYDLQKDASLKAIQTLIKWHHRVYRFIAYPTFVVGFWLVKLGLMKAPVLPEQTTGKPSNEEVLSNKKVQKTVR